MEKTIKFVELKTSKNNKPYVLVDFTDKARASCWKKELFPVFRSGAVVDVTLEKQGEYDVIVNAVLLNTATSDDFNSDGKSNRLFMSGRDQSIVAQVILKGAVEMVSNQVDYKMERIREDLNEAVDALSDAYKLALSKLE